jgi:hypothetical protein
LIKKVFQNVVRVLSKMMTRGELFKGTSYHAINGLFELCFKFPVFLMFFTMEKLNANMVMWYYLSEILIYPFQTAYKRLICQVIMLF